MRSYMRWFDSATNLVLEVNRLCFDVVQKANRVYERSIPAPVVMVIVERNFL